MLRRKVGQGEQFVRVRGQLTDDRAVFAPVGLHKNIQRGRGLGLRHPDVLQIRFGRVMP